MEKLENETHFLLAFFFLRFLLNWSLLCRSFPCHFNDSGLIAPRDFPCGQGSWRFVIERPMAHRAHFFGLSTSVCTALLFLWWEDSGWVKTQNQKKQIQDLLLMGEILHHLGSLDGWNPINSGMFTIYQLVQDFASIHSMIPYLRAKHHVFRNYCEVHLGAQTVIVSCQRVQDAPTVCAWKTSLGLASVFRRKFGQNSRSWWDLLKPCESVGPIWPPEAVVRQDRPDMTRQSNKGSRSNGPRAPGWINNDQHRTRQPGFNMI